MQRWILPVTATALLIAPAFAQNRPLACQADAAAGLNWENGQWEVTRFNPEPAKFILVQTGNSLTPESVTKLMDYGSTTPTPQSLLPSCKTKEFDDPLKQVVCTSGYTNGQSLVFSLRTLKGAMSQILGGIMNGPRYRDSVSVTTFTCQPF